MNRCRHRTVQTTSGRFQGLCLSETLAARLTIGDSSPRWRFRYLPLMALLLSEKKATQAPSPAPSVTRSSKFQPSKLTGLYTTFYSVICSYGRTLHIHLTTFGYYTCFAEFVACSWVAIRVLHVIIFTLGYTPCWNSKCAPQWIFLIGLGSSSRYCTLRVS